MCGSRDWEDVDYIYKTLTRVLRPTDVVIHGAAEGADCIAGMVADIIGCEVIRVPAEWDEYGKAAGPIRNDKMLKLKPDVVYAYHPFLPNSKGTADMVKKAEKKGLPVHVMGGTI